MTSPNETLKRAYLTIERLRARLAEAERARTEPIAVVGLGCRIPGGAVDADSFWTLLESGADVVTEIPPDRWDADEFYDARPQQPGRMTTRWGGFLDRVDTFDHEFFGITRREAVAMDPQQRLTLEVAWEALEDAGVDPHGLAGRQVGVFMGVSSYDFAARTFAGTRNVTAYTSTGTAHSMLTGRLSYVLDLRGPSVAVDTACSSSLTAVHLACTSLRAGECDLALSGGVNVVLSPLPSIAFSQFPGMVSPDGRCRAFDESANGYVRSEGCGVVVLKRLRDAVRDGDRVLAVIRGGAVNQDGRSSGVTAPNGAAQRAVLRDALAAAGVSAEDVSYVEAHGSGTRLGDPIEVEALADVYGRPDGPPVYLGSAKTNVGHAEAAAGIIGLLKVILSLDRGVIPPNVHFTRLNPHLSFDGTTFAVPTGPTPWPRRRRVAGVSAFGFSGTNVHLIVEAAPGHDADPAEPAADPGEAAADRPLSVLAISAKDDRALAELAARYRDRLAADDEATLADICFSANTGRARFTHRLAAVGATRREVAEQLADFADGLPVEEPVSGRATSSDVVFLFPGEDAARPDMGAGPYREEGAYLAAIDRCAQILRPLLDRLPAAVTGDGPADDDPALVAPGLFAVEYALAELWRSWGVEPAAVLGHGVGEYVAACVSGALTLEDGLRLAVARGRLAGQAPRGAALRVAADERTVARVVADTAGRVSIAAVNGPDHVVVAGEPGDVDAVRAALLAGGVAADPVPWPGPAHSPLAEPGLDELRRTAEAVEAARPGVPFAAGLTGRVWPWDRPLDAGYWVGQARGTVRFADAAAALRDLGYRTFLDLGPDPVLAGLVAASGGDTLALPSLRPGADDWRTLLTTLARLFVAGVDVDWRGFDAGHPRTRTRVPVYAFQPVRCWPDDAPVVPGLDAAGAESGRDDDGAAEDDELLYTPAWRPAPALTAGTAPRTAPLWVVLGGDDALTGGLAGLGVRCVRATTGGEYRLAGDTATLGGPADLDRLLADLGGDARIVYLWPRDAGADPAEAARDGLLAATAAVRAAVGHGARLWLVTRGATRPRDAHGVTQAALWGLGRSLQQEHAGVLGGLIDLDPDAAPEEAAAVLHREIEYGDGEDQVAYHDGARHAVRLERAEPPGGPADWRPDATYLITGGFGGVGLEVARAMAAAGARRLILAGRTPIPPRADWAGLPEDHPAASRVAAIRELERLGATVIPACLDVADEAALADLLDRHDREGHPPIAGVVHAAGTGEPAPLLDLAPDALDRQLHAKVRGAWALHRLFAGRPLDFFLLFSSTASVLSSPFAAAYAAANAMLDALAALRTAAGLPALSVNWGIWAGTGMAARDADGPLPGSAPALSKGMDELPPPRALRVFRRLPRYGGGAQVAVVPVDWAEWGRRYRETSGSRLLDVLIDDAARAPRGAAAPVRGALAGLVPARDELLAAPPGERAGLLTAALARAVAATTGAVTAVDPDRPLIGLGMDSLMAVELRNAVESRLRVSLPLSKLLAGATVRTLSDHIAGLLAADETPAGAGGAADAGADGRADDDGPVRIERVSRAGEITAELLARLDELSDEEVRGLA